jgi:hypothetical protein
MPKLISISPIPARACRGQGRGTHAGVAELAVYVPAEVVADVGARAAGDQGDSRDPGPGTTGRAVSWLGKAVRNARLIRLSRSRNSPIAGERQRPQPRPVGPQRVRQHERIEPVILAARGPVPGPQILHPPRLDHHHRQPRREQGLGPVPPPDRDLARPALTEPSDTRPVMRGAELVFHLACQVHHAHRVLPGCPVDPGAYTAGRTAIGPQQGSGKSRQ